MTVSKLGDDDINDLIETEDMANQGAKSEMKPLNLDHLSQGELDVPVKRTGGNVNDCSLCKLCCAYMIYMCEYAPTCCWAIGLALLLVPSYFLVMAVFFNPTEHFGVMHDYTDINSQYDLSLGKIDHWCLKGDNDSCRCEDPLDPQSRGEFRAWAKAQTENVILVNSLVAQGKTNPDIAFLGASIVEEMSGKWFGTDLDENLKSLRKMFEKNFKKSAGAELEAIALGIAGDTNPTVLWRLIHGEMPAEFNPKIWWLELGLNDLGRSQCSEEVVVLGVLRVVEEILEKKKDAIVVINSLFPLADLRGGVRPGESDYKDSFNSALRQVPTDKLKLKDQGRHPGRIRTSHQVADAGQTDHGDSTPIHHQKPHRSETLKKPHKEKSSNSPGRMLGERHGGRNRGVFHWGGNEKEVKMQAHKDKQKKFTPITHQERKLPLWTSVSSINVQLKKFANKHDRVHFFDVTEIFTEREDNDTYILKTDLISVRGHPSRSGFEKWEQEVIVKAKSLLAGIE